MTVSFLLQTVIVLLLVVFPVVRGVQNYRRLKTDADTEPNARTRYYQRTILRQWLLVAAIGLSLWVGASPLSAIGLRLPAVRPVSTALFLGMTLWLVLSLIIAQFRPKQMEQEQRDLDAARALIPVVREERWWFAAVAITAGVCEEISYRGLVVAYVSALLPSAPLAVAGAVSTVVFGLAHLYQGWKGVLGTGAMGAVFTLLYLDSGSLLLPVLLHALLDLRVLGVVKPAGREQP